MEKLLSVREVASVLGVSPSWIYSSCSAGKLPHFKIGSTIRFKGEEINKFLEENHVAAKCDDDWG